MTPGMQPSKAAALLFRIVDAACELRDTTGEEDCSREIEALDAAVDEWRKHLRKVRAENRQ